VFWDGVHNGLVQPLDTRTDAQGRAQALFTLGDTEGTASLYAAVVNVDSVPFRLEVQRSSNGINWSAPAVLELAHDGLYPWHVEVQWIPSRSEFWALYNAKEPGSCTTPADIVYRSTFSYDPVADDLRLWVSGARFDRKWIWSTFLIRKHRASLLDKTAVDGTPLAFPPPAAELVDWP